MPVNNSIFQTSTFRLAAIYLLVFVMSVGALLGYIYYNTAGLLERQAEAAIKEEVLGLADEYQQRGLLGVVETVERRSKESDSTLYLLTNGAHQHIAGDTIVVPGPDISDQSWIDFQVTMATATKPIKRTIRAYHVVLVGNYELFVGRDVEELNQFSDLIRQSLLAAIGLSLILGLGGGYLTSRNFLRRVDGITKSTQIIMAGDLSKRMPTSGSKDELDRLAGSLNDMLSQIERLMTGMKEVSSNVAHDLKTPLTRMRARVEAALRQDSKPEYKAALNQTLEECDKLLRTFNALLSIAQAESGQMRQGLQLLDLHEILTDVVELYEPLVEEAGGTLSLEAQVGLRVRGDRQLLAQVLNNLIDNAMKYGEDVDRQSDIKVTGRIENKVVMIEVADHGIGISAPDRERVLGRFVRLDESRSRPGNGLGLSLVASVMTLHSGQIQLEDNRPGLRVILRLPLYTEAS